MLTHTPTVSYTVIEPDTYMVLTLPQGSVLLDYCLTMAERNDIPGLLKVHRQFIDGETRLYYKITGKKKVADLCAGGLTDKQASRLLISLLRALDGLPEYFLDSGKCLLDTQLLFADTDMTVGLPLLPLEGVQPGGEALKQFFLSLIGTHLNRNGTSPLMDSAVSLLLRTEGHQAVAALTAHMQGDMAPAPAAPAPAPQPVPPPATPAPVAPKPQPPVIPAPAPAPAPAAPAVPPVPPAEPKVVGGIAIPGGPVIPPPEGKKVKEKPPKAEKPQKEKKPGLFGPRKGKESAPQLDMNRQGHVVPAPATPQPAPHTPQPAPGQEWRGTAFLEQSGGGHRGTVMLDTGAGPQGGSAAFSHGGRHVAVTATPFVIGRESGQYIISSPKVSATHVTIREQGGSYTVTDENSTNHSWLNGVMLQPYTATPIQNGDVLRLANEELRFTITR